MAKTKWKKKYRMYVQSKGWISSIRKQMKCDGRRYNFYNEEEPKYATLLDVEEVFDCACECKNEYNNWNYYVFPENEFIKEYEKYKKENVERINELKKYERSKRYSKININNILKPKKEHKEAKWTLLSREISNSFFGDTMIYYRLATDMGSTTSPVIGLKEKDGKYIFETYNSIYEVEEIKRLDYVDTLKEIKGYLKSKDFKAFKKYLKDNEAKEYEALKKDAKVKLEKKKEEYSLFN